MVPWALPEVIPEHLWVYFKCLNKGNFTILDNYQNPELSILILLFSAIYLITKAVIYDNADQKLNHILYLTAKTTEKCSLFCMITTVYIEISIIIKKTLV